MSSWLEYLKKQKTLGLSDDGHVYASVEVTPAGELQLTAIMDMTEESAGYIEDFLRTSGCEPLRICMVCGRPLTQGYTDEGDFYCCEEHFNDAMESYFSENYREVENDGCGGYYEYWDEYRDRYAPTGVYYTEW